MMTIDSPNTNLCPDASSSLDASGASVVYQQVEDRLQTLQQLVEEELAISFPCNPVLHETINSLADSIALASTNFQQTIDYADTLAIAQADALVRSAEIIEELEQTKAELLAARQQAERHREERLHLLSRVFENSREGVVILDVDGRIQECNPVFQDIARSSDELLLNRPLKSSLEWVFPDYDSVLQSTRIGDGWNGRVVVARGDDEERSYLVSFSPVQSDQDVSSVIVLFSDVTDIDRTQRCLKRQALHDQLTGLPNRRFYRERIDSLIEESSRNNSSFVVCFIDLDDFKQVNDSLGHLAGDELLIEVSRRISAAVGDDAFVARFGGDEFAILIPRTDEDLRKTATVTDAVQKCLGEAIDVAETNVRIGASIGVVEYPAQSQDGDELLQLADVAMYAAKKAGRNQTRAFAPQMREQVEQRHQIQRELHRALDDCEISVVYQPLVDLRTHKCISCEALARWKTPDGRQITPAEFIPVAEQSGLVIPLGEAILTMVCEQIVEWEKLSCRPDRVAVNVSPRQLYGQSFLTRIEKILNATGAKPEWLTMEITENAVMEDITHAMRIMRELASMGIQTALDDFGTGYSSLSYLKQFDVHCLKIDRSFVKDLPGDESARSIIESVIQLAKGRKISVVAEGIETAAQYRVLRELGCDVGQGYFIARPLRTIDMEAFVDVESPVSGQVSLSR